MGSNISIEFVLKVRIRREKERENFGVAKKNKKKKKKEWKSQHGIRELFFDEFFFWFCV